VNKEHEECLKRAQPVQERDEENQAVEGVRRRDLKGLEGKGKLKLRQEVDPVTKLRAWRVLVLFAASLKPSASRIRAKHVKCATTLQRLLIGGATVGL
jgi:hypothetical protein